MEKPERDGDEDIGEELDTEVCSDESDDKLPVLETETEPEDTGADDANPEVETGIDEALEREEEDDGWNDAERVSLVADAEEDIGNEDIDPPAAELVFETEFEAEDGCSDERDEERLVLVADTKTEDDADPEEIVDTDETVDGSMLVTENSDADGALALAFPLAELEVTTELLELGREVVGG